MTTEERLSRTEANLDRLATVVETLAGSVVAHDNQIEDLITITENLKTSIEDLKTTTENLKAAMDQQSQQIADQARQWQAYINTLPRH